MLGWRATHLDIRAYQPGPWPWLYDSEIANMLTRPTVRTQQSPNPCDWLECLGPGLRLVEFLRWQDWCVRMELADGSGWQLDLLWDGTRQEWRPSAQIVGGLLEIASRAEALDIRGVNVQVNKTSFDASVIADFSDVLTGFGDIVLPKPRRRRKKEMT